MLQFVTYFFENFARVLFGRDSGSGNPTCYKAGSTSTDPKIAAESHPMSVPIDPLARRQQESCPTGEPRVKRSFDFLENEESSSESSVPNRRYKTPSASYGGLHSSQASSEGHLPEYLNNLAFSGNRKASIEHGVPENPSPAGSNDYRSRASDGRKRSAGSFDRSAVEFGPRTGGMLGGIPKSSTFGDFDHSSMSPLLNTRSSLRHFDAINKLYDHRTRNRSRNQPPATDSNEWTATTSTPPVSNGMLLQPETHPITEEQLVNEVRGIYAGLVMVEKKCMEIDRQQSQSSNKLSDLQWQALIALHRTLLHEHHDFFLASQHPSASAALRKLAERYAMPARMWRYGIHSFLELLRHRLPSSLEHMLTFIYMSYSMMTLLLESVPSFKETWIECLGDLARYRMAVEENDMRDREVWSGVARYWYNQAADKNPDIGRIQHHLAVLARPNIVQQLFYYTKSLVSVHPFPSAKDSILLLFNPLLDAAKTANSRHPPLVMAFVSAHGIIFTKGSVSQFVGLVDTFLCLLDKYIGRVGAIFREQGVYIASSNYAAIFEYGQPDAIIPPMFDQKTMQSINSLERHKSARQFWDSSNGSISSRPDPYFTSGSISEETNFTESPQILSYASHLAFSTLAIILERLGDKNVLPHVHTSFSFLWCLALNPKSMMYIETEVPWARIAVFLNTLIRHDTDIVKIESEEFPYSETGTAQQLPEDFLIRGQSWSQLYYPRNFFRDTSDDETRSIELPSVIVPRTHRCLWLGVRIATLERWIMYDYEYKRFSVTLFASALENTARETNPFDRRSKTLSPEPRDQDAEQDVKMVDVKDEENTPSQMSSVADPDSNIAQSPTSD
ncbi:hypothetical protein Egran_00468 [Elaphomyces granulatus]|uniref:DNA/RNA-binding domain-containing protein n=1 Tax=Elaphomyces granulatus TaxID=519963 RepID=A0A232M5U8_9EURO|nr:hypothetical protein Egran_00468 [Elaphomyces granulatus]